MKSGVVFYTTARLKCGQQVSLWASHISRVQYVAGGYHIGQTVQLQKDKVEGRIQPGERQGEKVENRKQLSLGEKRKNEVNKIGNLRACVSSKGIWTLCC